MTNGFVARHEPFLGASAWIVVGIPLSVVLALASRDASWVERLNWFPLLFVVGVILFGILFGPGAIVIGVIHAELMDEIADRCTTREQMMGWSIATGALLAPFDLLPALMFSPLITIGAREIAVAVVCGAVCGYVAANWTMNHEFLRDEQCIF
jgi:hypothetical protein